MIPKANEGKSKLCNHHFLDKVNMDIVYSDCISMGGYRYGILIVNVATQYFWFYSLKYTASNDIINALSQFRADVGTLPRQYHADFD